MRVEGEDRVLGGFGEFALGIVMLGQRYACLVQMVEGQLKSLLDFQLARREFLKVQEFGPEIVGAAPQQYDFSVLGQ